MTALRAALFVIFILQIASVLASRQKRCIVIQRQSGAMAESESEEGRWREARNPKTSINHIKDVEVIRNHVRKNINNELSAPRLEAIVCGSCKDQCCVMNKSESLDSLNHQICDNYIYGFLPLWRFL